MQIKHCVVYVYVARLIEKVVETLLVDGAGGGATTPLQGVTTSCQLFGNHCKIYSDIV